MPKVVVDRSPELARGRDPFVLDGELTAETPAEVAGSVRGDGSHCVIAQACRQVWPGCEPHVDGEKPYVIRADGKRISLHLSASLVERVGKFDRGEGGFENVIITFRDRRKPS